MAEPVVNPKDDVLEWRAFRPLFEEEGIVDQTQGVFEFPFQSGGMLRIHQDPRLVARLDQSALSSTDIGASVTEQSSATGAVVWDSSVVVARFLESVCCPRDPNNVPDSKMVESDDLLSLCGDMSERRVMELGSGTGFLAAACWRLGAASVVASEREELMPLLARNIAENCSNQCTTAQGQPDGGTDNNTDNNGDRPISASQYMWGEPLSEDILRVLKDRRSSVRSSLLVLAVDCIYDEGAVAPLLDSIGSLLRLEGIREQGDEEGSSFSHESRAEGPVQPSLRPSIALVAVDSSYKRPKALALFLRSLPEKGLAAAEVSTSHLSFEEQRVSVRIWAVRSTQR
jgi:hypothetical protein